MSHLVDSGSIFMHYDQTEIVRRIEMKKVLALSLTFLMAITLCCQALAVTTRETATASSTSVKKICSVDNCQYVATAYVWVNPDDDLDGSYVGANSQVYSSAYSGKNVPAGYMGANARVYVDNSLKSSSGWTYNSGKGNAMSAGTGTFDVLLNPRKGIVFSQSKFSLYNGNGYDEYQTNRTPNLDVSNIYPASSRTAICAPLPGEIKVNAAGQTYGSGWLNPDLIDAVGIDGVHGYVLESELDAVGRKSSPEDTLTNVPTTIPLYAEDGITVIGAFRVGSSQVSEFSM